MTAVTPKVSICVPTYNNADEVARLLESVYSQSYTDFEVNISDDSTDREIERVVMEYANQYANQYASIHACTHACIHAGINYRHNEKPYGHIFNWNKAIEMARGEYIKIMFSDDWFTDSESLGSFVQLLDDAPAAALAFSGSRQVLLDKGMEYYDRCASSEFIDRLRRDYRLLFVGNEIGAPSASIYRRGDALTLFDEKSNWASDMYLYFDLLKKTPVFTYTKKPLVSIGVHESQYTESFSERDERIYSDYRYMYEKYGLRECRECREYFTKKFIVKYRKGAGEALSLGIEPLLFLGAYVGELRDSVRDFINARVKR